MNRLALAGMAVVLGAGLTGSVTTSAEAQTSAMLEQQFGQLCGNPDPSIAPMCLMLRKQIDDLKRYEQESAAEDRYDDGDSSSYASSQAAIGSTGAGGCRSEYDLSALKLASYYADASLENVASAMRNARGADAVNGAKAGGYDQQSAYRASLAQAESSRQAAEQSFASARALSSEDGSIDRYRRDGLPGNFRCDMAAAAGVCAGMTNLWGAEMAKQTAEIISCNW